MFAEDITNHHIFANFQNNVINPNEGTRLYFANIMTAHCTYCNIPGKQEVDINCALVYCKLHFS